MSRTDKLMLWGAVAIMIAVGSLSFYRTSQAPAIDPEIAALKQDYEKIWRRPAAPAPKVLIPNPGCKFGEVLDGPRPTEWAAFIQTKFVGTPVRHPDVPVFVLSLPTPKSAASTLDATTITWSLIQPDVELKYWMKPRNEVKPTSFIIKRQCESEAAEELAVVDGKTFTYTDLTTKPRLTYRYWVVAKGMESDLQRDPPSKTQVTKGLETSVQTRTPSDTRAKLVGGDKGNAFVRIETYDRTQKKWVGKTSMAVPGQKVGSSGWVLKGLRFDNFTLVADVTDDEGVDRVLTTKD